MALKNYTTDIPVYKTVSEIHEMLARHGARKVMFDYTADGRINAICFTIIGPYGHGEQAVKLPANADKVLAVLKNQKNDTKNRNRDRITATSEQAEMVAWRIVKDWLDAQLAILETEMVDIQQVFLPYFIDRNGKTLYEAFKAGDIGLLSDGSGGSI